VLSEGSVVVDIIIDRATLNLLPGLSERYVVLLSCPLRLRLIALKVGNHEVKARAGNFVCPYLVFGLTSIHSELRSCGHEPSVSLLGPYAGFHCSLFIVQKSEEIITAITVYSGI
jgi:hypothetical protein